MKNKFTIKFIALFLLTQIFLNCATSKKSSTVPIETMLATVEKTMKSVPNIRFSQYKHVHYEGAGYDEKDTMSMFHSFDTLNKSLPKFQIIGNRAIKTFIFNGTNFFTLDKNKKAHTNISDTKKVFSTSAYLFRQSWVNILNILPNVIENKEIIKTGNDTLINQRQYYVMRFYYPGKKFGALSGLTDLGTDTIQWRYELIVDKRNYLPTQFNLYIQTPAMKIPDYIKMAFDQVNTAPNYPDEQSWFFSTYEKDYPAYEGKEKRNPLIGVGTPFPNWELPSFTLESDHTLLSTEALKDQVVLYVFWTKNCGHCQRAMPFLKEMQQKFGEKQCQTIAINCLDTKDQIQLYLKKLNANYPICYNGNPLAEKIGIYAHPIFVLVDKNNVVSKIHAGFVPENITALVQALADKK